MIPVNRSIATYHTGYFYHVSMKNSDGTPLRCRVNGACKVWRTRPDDYRLPVKYGPRNSFRFYITPSNEAQWEITDDDWREVRRKMLCAHLKVDVSIPSSVLRDLAIDSGIDEEVANAICGSAG